MIGDCLHGILHLNLPETDRNLQSMHSSASSGRDYATILKRVYQQNLLIDCHIRYPEELVGSTIQITVWQTDQQIPANDVEDDYPGIGAFHSLADDTPSTAVRIACFSLYGL